MTAQIELPRRLDALSRLFAFTACAWTDEGLPPALRPRVDLVLEELFTNVVKYGRGTGNVALALRGVDGGVEVTLTDPDADFFDPTSAPAADTGAPIDQRQPGGLGLHLIRQLVDSLDHRYAQAERRSVVTFRLTERPEPASRGATG